MADQVVAAAMMTCTFGSGPSSLVVLPTNMVQGNYVPAANVMDHIPMTNIMPFIMCNSPSNPTVAAATAAALGVLTPMPCIPATASPWTPGCATVKLANQASLNNSSKLTCSYGGSISISFAGQTKLVEVP